MSDDYAARVARGAALLDALRPGWDDHVSIGTLDVSSTKDCVLGQAFGSYTVGVRSVFANPLVVVSACIREMLSDRHGFSAYETASLAAWGELTQAWRDLITERRCRTLKQDLFSDVNDEKVSISV